jgi:hypothetical protein
MASLFTDNGGTGDYLPIIKYDARAGRFMRVDGNGDTKTEKDITKDFAAIMDLENIEIGWVGFPGGKPDFRFKPFSEVVAVGLPPRPSDEHKEGFRLRIKLDKATGGDAQVREFSHSSRLVKGAINDLHNAYEHAPESRQGKLPVVSLVDIEPVKSKTPQGTTTNYKPLFSIVGWQDRPEDLDRPELEEKPVKSPASVRATPPATGSTVKTPPTQTAEARDFG